VSDIVHAMSRGQLAAKLERSTDGEVLAQELVQKGGMDALHTLIRRGCNEFEARAMLRDLGTMAETISAELVKRGMTPLADPRAD
jgi:hypothetical protein